MQGSGAKNLVKPNISRSTVCAPIVSRQLHSCALFPREVEGAPTTSTTIFAYQHSALSQYRPKAWAWHIKSTKHTNKRLTVVVVPFVRANNIGRLYTNAARLNNRRRLTQFLSYRSPRSQRVNFGRASEPSSSARAFLVRPYGRIRT
jgi:hypothetical protein